MSEDWIIDSGINIGTWNKYITRDFIKESDLCDFIDRNIYEFTKFIFDEEYLSHKREYYPYGMGRVPSKLKFRVDFFIRTNCLLSTICLVSPAH